MNRNNFPILIRLQVINNKNGNIIKFISKKNQYFKGFGEIYFSKIKKNHSKGWRIHKKNYSLLKIISGKIIIKTIFFYKKKIIKKNFLISSKKNVALLIPPKIIFNLISIDSISVIQNFSNNVHKKNEYAKFNKNELKKILNAKNINNLGF
jgi:dTDP-4-dehydrorhamnose 3,5-epimerase-like enzyme